MLVKLARVRNQSRPCQTNAPFFLRCGQEVARIARARAWWGEPLVSHQARKFPMKDTDLLVHALATPVALTCRQCETEFAAAAESPAAAIEICMTCYAVKYLAEHHRARFSNSVWITMERRKLAGVMARFAQSILVEKYLPYIPKFGGSPE